MTLQEKLQMQEQELYINEISKEEIDEMAQEGTKGNVVALRSGEAMTMDLVPSFAITLETAKERVRMLQEFVQDMMVPGVDYGLIPGCQKPSLYKTGAEKLTDIFGFSKQVEVTNRLEDWEKGIFAYEIKVTLINKKTGLVEAEGIGSCNSREKKYRDKDGYSIANTILKMSKKRALVDSVLTATRSSGFFTQDVEDLEIVQDMPSRPVQATNPKDDQVKMATEKQLKKMYFMTRQKNRTGTTARQLLKDRYSVDSSEKLTSQQASDFISHLIQLQG